MNYRVFLPSDGLIKTARSAIQALAIIASLAAICTAMAGTLYILTWLCGVLVAFIHAFSDVCQATFNAVNGNYVGVVATFIIWLMLLLSIKVTCLLLPSIMSFFRIQGVRV
jgi:hypothetical protein